MGYRSARDAVLEAIALQLDENGRPLNEKRLAYAYTDNMSTIPGGMMSQVEVAIFTTEQEVATLPVPPLHAPRPRVAPKVHF